VNGREIECRVAWEIGNGGREEEVGCGDKDAWRADEL
jgi:hypothetical protein